MAENICFNPVRLLTFFCHYRPQRSLGKVMFLHVSVILFTGVCHIAFWDTPSRTRHHPQDQAPPQTKNPPDQAPPGADTPGTWDPAPPRSRHPNRSKHPLEQTPPGPGTPSMEQTPPLEQTTLTRADTLPCAVHAGKYGQRVGGMHPT